MSKSLHNLEKRKNHWFQYQDFTILVSHELTDVPMEDEIVYIRKKKTYL